MDYLGIPRETVERITFMEPERYKRAQQQSLGDTLTMPKKLPNHNNRPVIEIDD
jgi:hypothetical protein